MNISKPQMFIMFHGPVQENLWNPSIFNEAFRIHTPQQKHAFCSSLNMPCEASDPPKKPNHPSESREKFVATRWPFLFPLSGISLGIPDIFQRKTVSRNHANSGKSSILRGNCWSFGPFPSPGNKQTLAGQAGRLFSGAISCEKPQECVLQGLFFHPPQLYHLEGPKRSYITFIYNIYSENLDGWKMEISTKRWPVWGGILFPSYGTNLASAAWWRTPRLTWCSDKWSEYKWILTINVYNP